MTVVMEGVKEYYSNNDVELDLEEGREVINSTVDIVSPVFDSVCSVIDLEQLLEWVSKNRPELYIKFLKKSPGSTVLSLNGCTLPWVNCV